MDLIFKSGFYFNKMPTNTQIVVAAVNSSNKYTDDKVNELQSQINDLKEQIKKRDADMAYILDVIGRLGISISDMKNK